MSSSEEANRKSYKLLPFVNVLEKCTCSPFNPIALGTVLVILSAIGLNVTAQAYPDFAHSIGSRSGGGVVDNTLDYQSRGLNIDPPLLRSFG